MNLSEILNKTTLKSKEKNQKISAALLSGELSEKSLLEFAAQARDVDRATLMEAAEYTTKSNPDFGSIHLLQFAGEQLSSEAPRVVWESSRVIGNLCRKYSDAALKLTPRLAANTEHEGTVVRWSTAYALSQILIQTKDKRLSELMRNISKKEKENSIRKIYDAALIKSASNVSTPAPRLSKPSTKSGKKSAAAAPGKKKNKAAIPKKKRS